MICPLKAISTINDGNLNILEKKDLFLNYIKTAIKTEKFIPWLRINCTTLNTPLKIGHSIKVLAFQMHYNDIPNDLVLLYDENTQTIYAKYIKRQRVWVLKTAFISESTIIEFLKINFLKIESSFSRNSLIDDTNIHIYVDTNRDQTLFVLIRELSEIRQN